MADTFSDSDEDGLPPAILPGIVPGPQYGARAASKSRPGTGEPAREARALRVQAAHGTAGSSASAMSRVRSTGSAEADHEDPARAARVGGALEALERRLDRRLEARLQAGLESLRTELLAELQGKEHKQGDAYSAGEGHKDSDKNHKDSDKNGHSSFHSFENSAKSESDVEYSFNESIWDASVFIGMPHVGCAGSVLVLLCLLLNIIVQVIFSLIVWNNLATSEFMPQDLAGLSAWRLKIGHDEKYVSDSVTYSLVDRVCNADTSLEMATEQINKIRLIKDYLPDIGNEGPMSIKHMLLRGETMCLLAMTIWFLAISKEISCVLDFIGAIRLLPSGGATELVDTDDDTVALKAISCSRRAFVMLLAVLRLTIAGFLLVIGGLYLCRTTSLADLLLNSMALEMVVSIDELVYEAMIPRVVSDLVPNLAPLAMRPWKRCGSADAKSMLMFPLLAGLLVAFSVFGLAETVVNLEEAYHRMCNGTRNFSYSVDALGMVHQRDLPSFDQRQAHDVTSYIDQAVQEVRSRVPREEWDYMLLEGGSPSLEDTIREIYTPPERRTLYCHNPLDTDWSDRDEGEEVPLYAQNQGRVWPRWLQWHLNRAEPITSCEDIREHCFFRESFDPRTVQVLRALCPRTCGCNLLTTGSWVASKEQGCPTVCLEYAGEENGDQWPCEDTDVSVNVTTQDDRRRTMQTWMGELTTLYSAEPFVAMMADAWYEGGCVGLSYIVGDYLCRQTGSTSGASYVFSPGAFEAQSGYLFKILTYMCPVTCNCGGVDPWREPAPREVCPGQCFCDWPYNASIPEQAPSEACVVPSPADLSLSSPVQTSPRCCHLMVQATTALYNLNLVMLQGNSSQGGDAIKDYTTASETICAVCRRGCLDLLGNVTFPGLNDTTIFAVMAQTPHELYCSSEWRRLLQRGALNATLGGSQQGVGEQRRHANRSSSDA